MPVLLHHGPPPTLAHQSRYAAGERLAGMILVLPTKRRIRHLTREILRDAGATPALPLHTLESLARALYAAASDSSRVVAGPVQTLLFSSAVKAVAADLRYFRVRGNEQQLFRGTFEKIVDVINHLKDSGVYPDLLEDEAKTAPPEERQKLLDVAAIYRAYEHNLSALAAEDLPGVYRTLAFKCTRQQFDAAFRSLFPDVTSVSLAGFDEFTQPEIGFIRNLCGVPGLSVSLLFDFLRGNEGLFGHLQENYTMFRDFGFTDIRTLPERDDVAFGIPPTRHEQHVAAAMQHIAQTLFNDRTDGRKADLASHATVIRTRTRVQEVELICKLIKRLVAERPDRDLNAICVAMVHPQRYTDILREQFARFGIPANITDRFELQRSPVTTAILAMLQIPLNGFRRDDVLRAVQAPYWNLGRQGESLDASNLEAVSRKLRLTAGYRTWLSRIEARRTALEQRRAAAEPGDNVRDIDREVRSLEKADADLRYLDEVTREITGAMAPAEFRRRLIRLLNRLGIARQLVAPAVQKEGDLMERDVRAYARFLELLDEAVRLLEFQDETPVSHPLRFYVEQLKVAATRERYNVREQFGRGVLVTSIEETRGLPVEVMIVAGLVDGEFPSVYEPEVFFSTDRQKLRERQHIWLNRYLFYQAVTNWREHLYLTYPERDDDLDLVRSPFVDALLKVADVRQWMTAAEIPFSGDLSSAEEFLCWWGGRLREESTPPAEIPSAVVHDTGAVRKAIAAEQSRMESHALPEFEGRIRGALDTVGQQSLEAMASRVFSAAQLESYGKCPYQYFATWLLRLQSVDQYDEDLSPLERGLVVHAILFEFYARRRDEGRPPIPGCSDGEFKRSVADIIRIGETHLSAIDVPDPFWPTERETILGSPGGTPGLLERFLAFERDRKDAARPEFFEVSFGLGRRSFGPADPVLSTPEPLVLEGINLSGKVDRIETGNGYFTIVDYKTGSTVPSMNEIRNGTSLQLPLYLAAVSRLLADRGRGDLLPAAGLYYRLRNAIELTLGLGSKEFRGEAFPKVHSSNQLLATNADLQGELTAAVARSQGYVRKIAGGEFPLTTPEKIAEVCQFCAFRTMCRIQNVRHVQPGHQEEP